METTLSSSLSWEKFGYDQKHHKNADISMFFYFDFAILKNKIKNGEKCVFLEQSI